MITYTEILQERLMQASCCEIFKARYADTDVLNLRLVRENIVYLEPSLNKYK